MMKKQPILISFLFFVAVTATVFGWGSNQHPDLANMVMNDPSISPYLTTFGLNKWAIAAAAFEPPNPEIYQWGGWTKAFNSGQNHNAYMLDPNFVALDENTRIGYILHNTCDESVPLNHGPANQIYIDQYYNVPLDPSTYDPSKPLYANPELYLETPYSYGGVVYGGNQQPLPSAMPTLYTGTYAEKIAQFWTDEMGPNGLVNRYKAANTPAVPFGYPRPMDVWAAQEGYTNALRLSQAVILDYFRLKMPEVANANGPYTVGPGGSVTLSSAGSYDPDGDTQTISWDLNNDGTFETTGASPTVSFSSLQAMGLQPNTPYTIKMKVVDDDTSTAGVYNEGTTTAQLALVNSAPVIASVTANPTFVALNGTVNFSATFTDADAGDSEKISWNFGDGSPTTLPVAATSPGQTQYNYSASGLYTVTVTVTDLSGASASQAVVVRVDTPPNATLTINPTFAAAGAPVELSAEFTDIDPMDTLTVTWNFGDGSDPMVEIFPASPAVTTHAWTDPGTYTVSVTVTDLFGGSSTKTGRVRINAPPTLSSLTTDTSFTNVEAPVQLTASFGDPDLGLAPTEVLSLTWNFADGSAPVTVNPATSPAQTSHAWASPGTYQVTATVTDVFGKTATQTVTVRVNAPPAIDSLTGPAVVTVPDVAQFVVNFTDPDEGDEHRITWDFGDGSPPITAGSATSPSTTNYSFSVLGPKTVTVTVTDKLGRSASATLSVYVNAVPVIASLTANPMVAAINTPVSFTSAFTDANTDDTHVAVWNFGDGSAPVTVNPATSPVQASHVYAASGIYTVTITVTDRAGKSVSSSLFVVIVNPAEGFTTGGGWFIPNSQSSIEGMQLPDDGVKADFGFNIKYNQNSTTPTGNLEFTYKAANLKLKSTAMDWLLMTTTVRFKGSCTVNGDGPFTYRVTAADNGEPGSQDTFKIEIWPGLIDTENTTVSPKICLQGTLGGGNIRIHK